jgi:hypothetical protein
LFACDRLHCVPTYGSRMVFYMDGCKATTSSYQGSLPVTQYARAKTSEAKRNLFAVLFDYVLYNLENHALSRKKPFPSTEQIQAVATALSLAEASECFAFAFRQGLPGVGEALAKSIVTAMARDVTSGRLSSGVRTLFSASLFGYVLNISRVRLIYNGVVSAWH